MKQKIVGESLCFNHYESMSEIMDRDLGAVNGIASSYYNNTLWGHRPDRDSAWYGVPDFAAFERCLTGGWPEGTEKMRNAIGELHVPRLPSVRRKRKWRDHGDTLDIHRVNMGRLDAAWQKTEREQALSKAGTSVTIAVDVGCNFTVNAANAMWRGAAATAIAEAAINSGRNVRVVLVAQCDGVYDSHSGTAFAIEVKSYQDATSVDILMTYLALPGVFRTLGIKALLDVPDSKGLDRGIGIACDFQRSLLDDGSSMVWIGRNVLTPELASAAAKTAVHAMIKRQQQPQAA